MGYGFATWDANGIDNNTGLVKINAVGIWVVDATETGARTFYRPSGYSLFALYQPAGDVLEGRRRITVSGDTVTISAAGSGDFSEGTIPNYPGAILVYAR